MPITHIIDYDAITHYLEEEHERNPNRTWTSFDILLTNINNSLTYLLNTETESTRTIAITLDSTNREVTVFGTPIEIPQEPLIVLAYMRDKSAQEQLYHLFTDLVDYAKRTEQYDRFFRSIETV